jgi:TonB family protein
MRTRFRVALLAAAVSLFIARSRGLAQEKKVDPLEGIEGIEFPQGQTVFQPRIEVWPARDILLSPVILQTGTSRRELYLGLSLLGVRGGSLGSLLLTLDGSPVTLDLAQKGDPKIDTSGCLWKATLNIEHEEDLVRRISKATHVQVEYTSHRTSLQSTLTADDLEGFRRIVALYDRDELPRAPKQDDYMDGHLVGLTPKGVTDPKLNFSSKVPPRYPAKALTNHKSGQVVMVARVLKDGTIGAVNPVRIKGAGCGFEEAAMEAVKRWRYTPAMKDGQPVDVEFTIVVDFLVR